MTYRDGPGGTISVSTTQSATISASVSGTGSYEVGGIIAKAKVEISASLTQTVSISGTHTFTHAITAGKYGNAQYGSYGKKVTWRRYQDNSNCTTTLIASGTAFIPTNTVGFRYWESAS